MQALFVSQYTVLCIYYNMFDLVYHVLSYKCVYIYIYMFREREIERERERESFEHICIFGSSLVLRRRRSRSACMQQTLKCSVCVFFPIRGKEGFPRFHCTVSLIRRRVADAVRRTKKEKQNACNRRRKT